MAIERMGSFDTFNELVGNYCETARNPESVFAGTVTRNADGAITSAEVVWPNGMIGTYMATHLSETYLGATDGYSITYNDPPQVTFIQPPITRDVAGYPTFIPPIEVQW